ncbi:MAG TPA: T9SS type A sorting domain-containing protein [Bacteroidia bacterium]|jgi:sugar lactone lactonase YvrE|nr:T9SS type A sorting domain-containing protein [Bacteroidia bacterium]
MKKLILTLSLATWCLSLVYSQIISTVAGGAAVTNVPATSIGMQIYGTVADKHGNLYVSDASNSIIRKVNLSTGITTIIAGIGKFGYSGDGGQATAAGLSGPAELGMDTAGNLYFGDGYSLIRKINIVTGIITTVAGNGTGGYSGDGGPATSAEISGESGIGFDKQNNLYIADFSNHRLRKVNAVTGIITTIAGTGVAGYNGDNKQATAAELYYPAGVCVDDSGSVYIAEQSNSRVRKINWKTNIITTFAGTGTPGYNGDSRQATTAELCNPLSVKLDTAGNMYIADWGTNRVRKITISTGIITTVAGNGTKGHSGDGGAATSAELSNSYCVALDTIGNIYVVEGYVPAAWNRWIRKVDAVTHNISTVVGNGGGGDYNGDGIPATSAQLDAPADVKVDAAGNLYVADYSNARVREINGAGMISTFAGNGTSGYLVNVPAATGEMYDPNGIEFDKSGDLFIADYMSNKVEKVNLNDSMLSFAGNGAGSPYSGFYFGDNGPATRAELYYPAGIAADDSGNVFIADFYNNRIRKVEWNTGIITTIAGNGASGYFGDGGQATAAKLSYPIQVAVDDSDNIYIADANNSRIRKVTHATGKISTVAGTGVFGYNGDGGLATAADLYFPQGITIDANGVLYISDTYNQRIRAVDPWDHKIRTVAGDGNLGFSGDGGAATSAKLNYPENVAFDGAGTMYIADWGNNRIRKVTNVAGVNEVKNAIAHAKVYPNPNNGIFTIQLSGVSGKSLMEIYNMLGERIYSQSFSTLSSQFSIDIHNNPAGVYLYRVLAETGNLVAEGKVSIQ